MGAGALARLSCIDRGLGLKFCAPMVVLIRLPLRSLAHTTQFGFQQRDDNKALGKHPVVQVRAFPISGTRHIGKRYS
jgi:hypothetical protein